jgi:CDP-4-dehydro-6-deoxyglucose reductase
MSIAQITSGRRFDVAERESILDAALRAKVALAYSCRTGRCSTCKGRVRRGTTEALRDEPGLTGAELADGWILTCVRSASTDVELEVEDLGDVRLSPARTLPCRIHAIDPVAPDVLKVVLRLPPTSDFQFLPGQYIDVIAHGGMRRSYSIANAPVADKHIELHVRMVRDGEMSRYWFEQARPNDLLRLNGPLGTFFLRDVEDLDLVFLATGTGIAPVKAMLEGLAHSQLSRPRSITVFWGGRQTDDLYWDATQSAATHLYVPVLSRADSHWSGARGYVHQVLLERRVDWPRTVVYACGSDAMIHSARAQLLGAGLNPDRFYSDAFVCSATV